MNDRLSRINKGIYSLLVQLHVYQVNERDLLSVSTEAVECWEIVTVEASAVAKHNEVIYCWPSTAEWWINGIYERLYVYTCEGERESQSFTLY